MVIEHDIRASGVIEGHNFSDPEDVSKSARLFLVRFKGESDEPLKPVIVNQVVTDPVGGFILEQEQCLEDAIAKKAAKLNQLSRVGSHSRLLKKSSLNIIREDREKEIRRLSEKLKVLSGESFQPLVLTREGQEITGVEIGSFTPEESTWWRYVKDGRLNLLRLPEEDFNVILKAFSLRYDWRQGSTEAKEEYFRFIREYSKREDLVSYLAEVTKFFSKN